MDTVNQVLIDRLLQRGADASLVDSLLRALSKILAEDPTMDPDAATNRLHYLGWPEIQIDYHTLQLALAHFESRQRPRSVHRGRNPPARHAPAGGRSRPDRPQRPLTRTGGAARPRRPGSPSEQAIRQLFDLKLPEVVGWQLCVLSQQS